MMMHEANKMVSRALSTHDPLGDVRVCFTLCDPLWYAVYMNANHEKRVAEQLRHRYIEHLLPLYESLRRWKDRRVRLQLPLFPGYVFVRLALRDRLQVLQIPGVVDLVSFGGRPAPLREEEIHAVKTCLDHGSRIEPHPYLQAGRRVQVKSGPLQGMEGIILRRKNGPRLILSFEHLRRSVAVEMEEIDLAPAS